MGTKKMGSKGGGVVEDPKSYSLPRQGSLYSLTLDEVQNQLGDLGKPLSSMNLDELLKAAGMGIIDDNIVSSQSAPLSSLHRQASLMLSGDLSKKTVDEVWRDIQTNNNSERRIHERQPTLGEITLEDFLVKAGIVAESSSPGQQSLSPDIQMAILSDTQTPRQKRVAPLDVVEKTVERRQKRMIKNRESAARSRARKQAYTQELENKISRLEEENERLKKQKELEKLMKCAPPTEPKYQLRRTSSGPL